MSVVTALEEQIALARVALEGTTQTRLAPVALDTFYTFNSFSYNSERMHERIFSLKRLADALMAAYSVSHLLVALEEAIILYEEVLQLLPSGSGQELYADSLDDSAEALFKFSFYHDLNRTRADRCLAGFREVLQLRPPGHSKRDRSLHNLAKSLFHLSYVQMGDQDALAECISLHREAMDLRPPGHPDRKLSMRGLCGALMKSFEEQSDTSLLLEATALAREALHSYSSEDPARRGAVNTLGVILTIGYERQGDLQILFEAISLSREVLQICEPGHKFRCDALHNLANVLSYRFAHQGLRESLEEAICLVREALHLAAETHPRRRGYMATLGELLLASFKAYGHPEVLDEAIHLSRAALHLRPPGHPRRHRSLVTLAESLEANVDHGGSSESLPEVTTLYREALQNTTHGHWQRVEVVEKLARMLCRPECQAWREAHTLYHEALTMCPAGYPTRAQLLSGLSHCFLDRSSPFFDLSRGISLLADGYADSFSDVGQRVRSAVLDLRRVEVACRTVADDGDLASDKLHGASSAAEILQLYMQVIGLLPRAANFGLDHNARLRAVVGSDEITRNAAARAAILGRVTQAVELLEEGRGVFWSQSLHLRVAGLDNVPDAEGRELKRLLRLLEQDGRTTQIPKPTTIQRDRYLENRRQLNEAAEALITKMRSYPGLGRFLLPAAFESVFADLPEGFVVIVNASTLGHHALILSQSHKMTVKLDLKPSHMGFDSSTLRAQLPRDGNQPEDAEPVGFDVTRAMRLKTGETKSSLDNVLAVLWTSIVQPVLSKLNLPVSDNNGSLPFCAHLHLTQKAAGRARPRLWWCVTGEFTFLPVHAAGSYHGDSPVCTADFVVSSYIPTLSALTRTRRDWKPISRTELGALFICETLPDGSAASHLSHAADEARTVGSCFELAQAHVFNEISTHATLSEVRLLLENTPAHILHLACHGVQDPNPLKSAILLQDGRLSIEDIMQFDLPHAVLAFLSACQTAKGDRDAPDQAVHLAASMLFCGFRSVIGTMWCALGILCSRDSY
jgi:tetratricopeptide (TPR) repeat protein